MTHDIVNTSGTTTGTQNLGAITVNFGKQTQSKNSNTALIGTAGHIGEFDNSDISLITDISTKYTNKFEKETTIAPLTDLTETVLVPIGDNFISAPITDGVVVGGSWRGGGRSQQYSSADARGPVSAYTWDHAITPDPSGLAMFYYEGIQGVLRDFCFYGRPKIQDTTSIKPGYGILVHKNLSGFLVGTGKLLLENMYIEDCAVGMQTSIDSSDPHYPLLNSEENADNCTLRRVTFQDCDIGFRSMHIQSMNHNFYNVIFRFCPICIEVDGGGAFYMEGVHSFDTAPATLLNITATSGKTWWRNGLFHIRGTKWDAQKPAGSPFLKMNKTPGANLVCTILFEQISIGNLTYPADNSMFQISGGTSCTIRDSVGIGSGALDWFDDSASGVKGPPMFIVENSKFSSGITSPLAIFSTINSSGVCYCHVSNCTDVNGNQIEDFHGIISSDGTVSPTEITQTATTTQLNDITASINTNIAKIPGKIIFNTSLNKPVYASGNSDADDWYDATGGIANSPI